MYLLAASAVNLVATDGSKYESLGSYFAQGKLEGPAQSPSDCNEFESIRAVNRDLLVKATLAEKAVSAYSVYISCSKPLNCA